MLLALELTLSPSGIVKLEVKEKGCRGEKSQPYALFNWEGWHAGDDDVDDNTTSSSEASGFIQ